MQKVIFMGSDGIGLPLLDFLKANENKFGYRLEGVITQPDKAVGRGKHFRANPIAEWGETNNKLVRKPEKPGPEEVEWCSQVDLVLVLAYGHILRENLLAAPRLPMLNFHGSILPKYRGASPIHGALINGETETGMTLMRVIKKMDAGPILDIEKVSIDSAETHPSLRKKLADACIPLLERNFKEILAGELNFQEQDENLATYTQKIQKSDGQIDFSEPAELTERKFRAYQPWPGLFFEHKGTTLKIGNCKATPPLSPGNPGSIAFLKPDTIGLHTSNGILEILEIQRPGGKMLPTKEFLKGYTF